MMNVTNNDNNQNKMNRMKTKLTIVGTSILLGSSLWLNAVEKAAAPASEGQHKQGSPEEMVTMYYDQNGKLAMTHYCVFGNRPGMLLKASDSQSIKFDFDATCGIDPRKESH